MQKTFQAGYLAPEVEVLHVAVEHGFGGSGGDDSQLPSYKEDGDDIVLG